MKQVYVELMRLEQLTYEGETQEQKERWLRNLDASGVRHNGFMLAGEDDYERAELDDSELEAVESSEATLYNFMGSQYEQERFYARDDTVYKHKVSGLYYAVDTDELDIF